MESLLPLIKDGGLAFACAVLFYLLLEEKKDRRAREAKSDLQLEMALKVINQNTRALTRQNIALGVSDEDGTEEARRDTAR